MVSRRAGTALVALLALATAASARPRPLARGPADEPAEILRDRHGYSQKEIALLTEADLRAGGDLVYVAPNLVELLLTRTLEGGAGEGPFARYLNPDGSEIATSRALPVPAITIKSKREYGDYPLVSVPPATDAGGNRLLVLFEFDVAPSFDTPNLWRTPVLLPVFEQTDRSSRRGAAFRLQTALETNGLDNSVRFPFRASAMRLPLREEEMTQDEMTRHARALAWGLTGEARIAEVFNYVRTLYHWSSDLLPHTPYDTFVSGMGECGYVNQIAGTYLEMNGGRYRSVSGFNPLARAVFPGGGHTAVEVWNEVAQTWSYLDSYLNLRLDRPVRLAFETSQAEARIYDLPPELHDELGPSLGLAELFRFRTYFDLATRAPQMPMTALENEDEYGLGWSLLEAPEYTADQLWPKEISIHVRARYIDTRGRPLTREAALSAVFSPASETSFTIHPLRGKRRQGTRVIATGVSPVREGTRAPPSGPVLEVEAEAPRAISSSFLVPYGPWYAFDGTRGAWNSAARGAEAVGEFVGVDLGSARKVEKLRVQWIYGASTPRVLGIEFSDDGRTWEEAAELQVDYSSEVPAFRIDEVELSEEVPHRYWRLIAREVPQDRGFGVSELWFEEAPTEEPPQ